MRNASANRSGSARREIGAIPVKWPNGGLTPFARKRGLPPSWARAELPIEEPHDIRVCVPAGDVLADEAVFAAGVGHEVEGFLQVLQLLHQHRAVREQHVVVGHAVHQQQRPGELVGVGEHIARGVTRGVGLRSR